MQPALPPPCTGGKAKKYCLHAEGMHGALSDSPGLAYRTRCCSHEIVFMKCCCTFSYTLTLPA
jgi:hypothetical protein